MKRPAAPSIDTRGELLLPPTEEMWDAMRSAEIGWPLRQEDPNVLQLERLAAEMTGQEAALLCPTTNVSNLLALMSLCARGDVAIMEARCHLWWVEERNIAAHTGAVPRLIGGGRLGMMGISEIEAALVESAYGLHPRTSVVCLENTHNVAGGVALPASYLAEVAEVAHRHGAAVFVDGARLFNAAVAHGVTLREMASAVDAVSLSLNKGIGAPYGSMLCGSTKIVEAARDHHRVLGSHSVHKEGIFAAAAIVALETLVDRLAEDHARARRLAELLNELDGIRVDLETVQTNIVRAEIDCMSPAEFIDRMSENGVGVMVLDSQSVKFITHRGIGDADIDAVAEIARGVLN